MKRKLLLILGLVFVMTASLACVAGCDSATKPEHEHEYAAAWVSDGESHWHECSCGEKADAEAHKGGTATCTAKAVCEVCGEAYGELDLTNHASDEFEYVSKGNGKHDKVYKCCKAAATENEDCSGGTATCTEKAVCEFCKAEYGDTLAHDFKTEWSSDETEHWHECSVCGEKADVEAHKGGAATCAAKAVCEVCGEAYGELDLTNHASDEFEYVSKGNGKHDKVYKCCKAAATENEDCSGGTATCTEKAVCEFCKAEYGDTLAHDLKTEWSSNETEHWHECSVCGEKADVEAHKGGAATCTAKAVCEVCETEYGDTLGHDFKKEWSSDGDNHWHECSRCSEKTDIAAHTVTEWVTTDGGRTGKCVCGKELIVAVENVATDKITLYTVETLADASYAHSVAYAPSVTVNGEAIEVTVTVSGDEAVYTADNKLEAVAAGTVTVTVKYTIAGEEITKSFEVEIIKPVITVDTAVNYFSAIDGKDSSVDLFEYFNGVTFTAKQTYGGQEIALTVDAENKALLGAVTESKKATVCSITLDSDNYGVVYNKVTAYTKVITDYTDFEDMRLTADKKTIEGYFILNADIDLKDADIDGDGTVGNYDTFYRYYDPKALAPTDMLTNVNDKNYGFGFVGVFDGNGHKINGFRSGNSYGFFGTISGKSMNDMTEIKNVAFTNIQAAYSSWTKGRVLAEYATFVKVENVYMSFDVTENWVKNYSIFGCAETVYFRFNKMIIEMSKTYEGSAVQGETAAVGIFASAGATAYYGKMPDNQWHYKMISVYNNMYFVAQPAASGRILPLQQSTAVTVYASNDFADIEENSSVSLNATTLNPEVNASSSLKLYHWANAYRYDNYEQMKEATTKVGNWDISSGAPVWVA